MENRELSGYLESSNNNLEEAIELLQRLSLSNQDLPKQYAGALVARFEGESKEETVEIATNPFTKESQAPSANKHPSHSEKLIDYYAKLIQDNTTLKYTVVKLKEYADSVTTLEIEVVELKNEVQ